MAYFPIKLPPGVSRNGTEFGSKGRYYDAYLVRWTEDGTLKPVGGWRLRSEDPDNEVSGAARALFPWKDNADDTWLGIGTHSGLFVQDRAGETFDITPTGFNPGFADADSAGGYGDGLYGEGTYGTPRPDSSLILPATQWTLDNWGENLVGVSPDDTKIYEWEPDTADDAVEVSGAPQCKALVVTAEGFLFALASTDPRTVSWCDQRNNTLWTPDATNQAGEFALQTQGALMCGKVVKAGTLLFTDLDVHLATYIGGTLVYAFDKLASACGVISRQAVAVIDAQAVWMSKSGFWIFNGYVQPLPCDVLDYVYSDFNDLQASKTYAVRDSANSEALFYYCSGSSAEIDRCVIWNYKFNYWNIGRVPRTCGADRGVFTYPIFVDADGAIHEHEVGLSYGSDAPYAEAGPIEIGNGDTVVRIQGIIPDERTSGQTEVKFFGKFFPNGPEESAGPFTMAPKVDVRFTARQAKIRIGGATEGGVVIPTDWRFGMLKLDGVAGGLR